jgi:hypothetical protein
LKCNVVPTERVIPMIAGSHPFIRFGLSKLVGIDWSGAPYHRDNRMVSGKPALRNINMRKCAEFMMENTGIKLSDDSWLLIIISKKEPGYVNPVFFCKSGD